MKTITMFAIILISAYIGSFAAIISIQSLTMTDLQTVTSALVLRVLMFLLHRIAVLRRVIRYFPQNLRRNAEI